MRGLTRSSSARFPEECDGPRARWNARVAVRCRDQLLKTRSRFEMTRHSFHEIISVSILPPANYIATSFTRVSGVPTRPSAVGYSKPPM